MAIWFGRQSKNAIRDKDFRLAKFIEYLLQLGFNNLVDATPINALKLQANYAAHPSNSNVSMAVTTFGQSQATFHGHSVVQLIDLLPSNLRKIIGYIIEEKFLGKFPPIAQVSKYFYSLYSQTVQKGSLEGHRNARAREVRAYLQSAFCGRFPNLCSLDLASCSGLTDAELEYLQNLPTVQHLSLMGCNA